MPLVEHAYCVIEEILPGVLQCTTRGVWITRLTFLAAGFFLLGGLANLGIFYYAGRLFQPLSILTLLLVFGAGAFIFWRANLRTQEMGTFKFDTNAKVFSIDKTGLSYPLDDIENIRTNWDWAGPTRMDAVFKMPHWLKLELKNGDQYRIGHGSKEELEIVTAWLREAGVE